MSLFPRAFTGYDNSASFHPLFRLLDDFDNYSKAAGSNSPASRSSSLRTFTPKFDVKEVAEGYELHGELPGIDQKDIEIEFSDPQTISIRGRTERSYTSGPSGAIEGEQRGAITDASEASKAHKATVEDEEAAEKPSTAVAKAQEPQQQPKEPQAKYWVSERSVGEFHRSFTFPTRVDQDAVKASMKNGVLSIMVPKAKKHEGRRIAIE